MSEGPEVAELIELVQTRLGTTRAAAEEYVNRSVLGEPQTAPTSIQDALTTFRAMPALVSAPTPVSPSLTRLHQIMADMEWITASVEKHEIMPTPDEIQGLFSYAARMKVAAEAAGFEFEADK